MKEKRTGKRSVSQRTEWRRVGALEDGQIRKSIGADPDARATDPEFWQGARVVMPQPKQTITIRLDADVLEWLRQQTGYQTRINAVLRAYMEANLPPRQHDRP